MSEHVELFDGRRGEVLLKVADNKAWVRTLDGQELVDLADVAPIDPTPKRICGVAKPKPSKLPQLKDVVRLPEPVKPRAADRASLWIGQWPTSTKRRRKTFRGPGIELNTDNSNRIQRRRLGVIAGAHAHYWVLDAASLGTCSVCGVVKDFRQKLRDLDPFNAGRRRPRKESDIE